MFKRHLAVLLAAVVCAGAACAQEPVTEASITKQLQGLRAVPDAQRPAVTEKLALDIRTMPAGLPKLKLAVGLSHLATEGDPGRPALNAVAETLAEALKDNPLPPKTPDAPPASPYVELAKLIRYEHVTATLDDPQMAKADALLAAEDADVQKTDFTLKDLNNKKVTLSELKGKIVLVNFWATWCPPCRKEMPDLDAIYQHFKSQGLVILSLSDEDAMKVASYIGSTGYHPPVLLDSGGKVAKQFHVDGIPKSFVFDRDGKLVAQSIDMRTQHQFLMMLAAAGLHP
jgi:thiol-disulfide isomerase/thioredoxin